MTAGQELTDVFRQQAAQARRTRGRWTSVTGLRHGWTLTAGVPAVVAPFVLAPPARASQVVWFDGLDGGAAAELLRRLPPIALLDRQNAGPSLGATLRAAVDSPVVRSLEGYVVGPGRRDERVSVTGVVVDGFLDLEIQDDPEMCDAGFCDCLALWLAVQHEAPLDALGPPSSVEEDRWGWRLWWT